MPKLSKKALSLFLRNGCERQFVFSLYTKDAERQKYNLPDRLAGRGALGYTAQAGYEWQDKKILEIQDVFGAADVYVLPKKGNRPAKIDLLRTLPKVRGCQFIVEANYDGNTSTFRQAVDFTNLLDHDDNEVDIQSLQPDIVQVLPSSFVGPNSEGTSQRNPYQYAVLPDGQLSPLAPNDSRLKLRVIDIKLSSEPGPHYFAEVVFYSMTLAAWLLEHRLESKYVVVSAPAVWPGSHEASHLAKQFADWKSKGYQPDSLDKALALEEDLEIAEFDVFAPRLTRFLTEEFPVILRKPLSDLAWHVDFRCKGCEFLGNPTSDDPRLCWPMAQAQRHLSRVVGLSRGASETLREKNIPDIHTLATTDATSFVFDDHQGLRSKRSIYPHRAKALRDNLTSVIPNSGGDALMPRWPDLHIYVFLDYDLSSAITTSIGLRAFWREPHPFGSQEAPHVMNWTPKKGDSFVYLVDDPKLPREREEFLKFLRQLREIFDAVIESDAKDTEVGRRDKKIAHSSYQIYLWDEAQRKHLVRLVGRHLPYILSDPKLRGLAWLFPPHELLQHAEDAARQSPITLVLNVVDNTIAVPLPHHHQLLDVVKTYKPDNVTAPTVHPFYKEPMSDLLPAERIHEWWQHIGDYHATQNLIHEATQAKVLALNLIVSRLENDLRSVLLRQAAPPLQERPRDTKKIAPQSRLWLEYARLNAALDHLEVHTIRSMPCHERVARLKSARLVRRLSGYQEQRALAVLSKTIDRTLVASPNLFVYLMQPDSKEVNLREGDFQCALAPENYFGFLDEHPYRFIQGTPLEGEVHSKSMEDAQLTAVTVEAIARDSGYIALRASHRARIRELEGAGKLDLSGNVVLDPIYEDFLVDKLKLTLQGIGSPPNATDDQRALESLGLTSSQPGKTAITAASQILWEAPALHALLTQRDGPAIRAALQSYSTNSVQLDASQWAAFEQALTQRLSLIWGPPGTGKSKTLRTIVIGAVLNAHVTKTPLRLLITANTYTAIDNVLLQLSRDLRAVLPDKPYMICRIQSKWKTEDDISTFPDVINLVLNTSQPTPEIEDLAHRLDEHSGIIIVGCPPQQLHNLSVRGIAKKDRKPKDTIRAWFDLIVLDEASQMDIATSTLVFTKMDPDGSLILAGDNLQLPPIQKADPPSELESVVGSTFDYFRNHHTIRPSSLDINYRSNKTLVDFTKLAGYSPDLKSYSPDLKLEFLTALPTEQPANWPKHLFWAPDWELFLDPAFAAVAFIYEDRLSSQINDFEAEAVVALITLLNGRLCNQLLNDARQPQTSAAKSPYTVSQFWEKAVGVVTPHRAQMAKIIVRLQQIFPDHPSKLIRSAVDTVERFQGQERDVIIASFGVGDPDIIGSEQEFLYNLNRFNVLTSRARAKLIVFVTRPLLDHLADDIDILKESRLLKQFAEAYCVNSQLIQVGCVKNLKSIKRAGYLRRK